ncbi:MAG TPA: hypothetical protein ENJ06_03085 [Phycisphaeraceae bacterium]|nr:hypothetical protein [Phycisphaeraceae bacterium]
MLKRTFILLAFLFTGLIISPLSAQVISHDLVTAQSLSPDDQSLVQQFVNTHLDKISTGGALDRRNSRRALLVSLQDPDASPAFRLAFSKAAIEKLKTLSTSDKPHISTSALMILGWVGTDMSTDAIIRDLNNDNNIVRYGAAKALRRTFLLVRKGSAVVPPASLWKAVRRLSSSLSRETDPYVVRSLVEALLASDHKDAGVELCNSLAMRFDHAITPDNVKDETREFLLDAYLRAMLGLRNMLIQPDQANPRLPKAAAHTGAHALVWCECIHETAPGIAEEKLSPLAEASEVLLLSAHLNYAHEQRPQRIAAIVKVKGWPGFKQALNDWVGADGQLYKSPYNFPRDIFTKNSCL